MNNNRVKWVNSMVERFLAMEASNPKSIGAIVIDRQVSVVFLDTKDPKIGVAKCNPSDKFDMRTGVAIAYARATGRKVPDFIMNDDTIAFTKVKIGEVFDYQNNTYIKITSNRAYCYQNNSPRGFAKDCYVRLITD